MLNIHNVADQSRQSTRAPNSQCYIILGVKHSWTTCWLCYETNLPATKIIHIHCYLIIHLKLFTSLACLASSGSAFHANHSGIGEVPFEKLSVGFWNTFVYVAASSFIMVDLTNWCKVACQFRLIKGQTDQRRNFLKLRDLPFLTF